MPICEPTIIITELETIRGNLTGADYLYMVAIDEYRFRVVIETPIYNTGGKLLGSEAKIEGPNTKFYGVITKVELPFKTELVLLLGEVRSEEEKERLKELALMDSLKEDKPEIDAKYFEI